MERNYNGNIGGLATGSVAIVVFLLLRLFAGELSLPELTSQTLFSLTNGPNVHVYLSTDKTVSNFIDLGR